MHYTVFYKELVLSIIVILIKVQVVESEKLCSEAFFITYIETLSLRVAVYICEIDCCT